ncbi:MAG: hypothetical protein JNK07_07290 [Alphaproteobacteria bacterium]|nr:hypothetical protein [Alphaproteobacteria bacterium]
MPAPRKQTDSGDAAFFTALQQGVAVVEAARLTGCSRQALYRRRICDHAFDKRWREIERSRKTPRGPSSKRFRQPVFAPPDDGRSTYSNAMLLARLKAIRPRLYLDHKQPRR